MTRRILVIDDEDRIREIVCACLEDIGAWQTETAASGREGILKAASEPFDVILLDVSMPEMDGFAVFEALQANAATRSIPVILLTAKVLPTDKARFAQMGIAGLITKPFNPLTISDEVAEIMGWIDPI
jgi:CheY-like chemotaxis protein